MEQKNTLSQKELFQQKVNNARSNLLLVIVFTIINIVLVLLGSETTFLFSATMPYLSVALGYFSEFTPFFVAGLITSLLIIVGYFLCWLFSKKHFGWMIAALVLFSIDTLCLIGVYVMIQDFSGVIDFAIHIWVLYYLIIGVKYGYKLKNMPVESKSEESFVYEQAPVIEEATQFEVSAPLRRADTEVKSRTLLETNYNGRHICYRRVKRVNELVIDGYVYDDVEILVELAHSLTAKLDGHTYQVGYDGSVHSYLSVDGNTVMKKLRLY